MTKKRKNLFLLPLKKRKIFVLNFSLQELKQMEGIFKMDGFKKDPVGSIQNHLKNSLQQKITKEVKKKENEQLRKRKRNDEDDLFE